MLVPECPVISTLALDREVCAFTQNFMMLQQKKDEESVL